MYTFVFWSIYTSQIIIVIQKSVAAYIRRHSRPLFNIQSFCLIPLFLYSNIQTVVIVLLPLSTSLFSTVFFLSLHLKQNSFLAMFLCMFFLFLHTLRACIIPCCFFSLLSFADTHKIIAIRFVFRYINAYHHNCYYCDFFLALSFSVFFRLIITFIWKFMKFKRFFS